MIIALWFHWMEWRFKRRTDTLGLDSSILLLHGRDDMVAQDQRQRRLHTLASITPHLPRTSVDESSLGHTADWSRGAGVVIPSVKLPERINLHPKIFEKTQWQYRHSVWPFLDKQQL